MPEFDFEGVFGPDYLYFYEPVLTPELSDEQAGLIARLLGLEPGTDVLDVPCGHGRIANRLARLGCRVVGLDASDLFLERAQADAAAAGVSVEYVRGDMRELPWEGRFDRVVNWFTSFGYFGDEENEQVLRGFHRALRPGGKLLLEVNHVFWLVRSIRPGVPLGLLHKREGDLLIDRFEYDVAEGRWITERTMVRGGRVRTARFSIRMPTFPELRDWLLDAGFARVAAYGLDGEPLTLESRRLIVVAERD